MTRLTLIVAFAGLAMASMAQAQNRTGARLIDGNANFDVGATPSSSTAIPSSTTSGGVSFTANLRVNGGATPTSGTDNAFTAWWWYRTGTDTREFALANPASRTLAADGRSVNYTFVQSGLNFSLTFAVESLGAQHGRVNSTLQVSNNGTADIAGVNLFWYVDTFLAGADANDFVTGTSTDGGVRRVLMRDSSVAGANYFGEVTGVGATGFGVGSFTLVGSQVGDTSIDNFADVVGTGTASPGQDQSAIMQWDLGTIAAGTSATVLGQYSVSVPTPGAAALLGLGGLLAARRRRA